MPRNSSHEAKENALNNKNIAVITLAGMIFVITVAGAYRWATYPSTVSGIQDTYDGKYHTDVPDPSNPYKLPPEQSKIYDDMANMAKQRLNKPDLTPEERKNAESDIAFAEQMRTIMQDWQAAQYKLDHK
jgi:hypothetical protein